MSEQNGRFYIETKRAQLLVLYFKQTLIIVCNFHSQINSFVFFIQIRFSYLYTIKFVTFFICLIYNLNEYFKW